MKSHNFRLLRSTDYAYGPISIRLIIHVQGIDNIDPLQPV
jgi:hypothetical protein